MTAAALLGPAEVGDSAAALVDRQPRGLHPPLPAGADLELVPAASDEGRKVLRPSAAHLLAQAVSGLFPGAKYAIGPPVEDGFYYDFDVPEPFTPDDLERISSRMRALVKANQRFVREGLS